MVLDKKQQKIIIFDWDDTICPSSFVDRCNIENVSELPEHVSSLTKQRADSDS
jgi:hypothetical protein